MADATVRRVDWDALSLKLVFGLIAAVAVFFLLAPTIIVLVTSFTSSESLKFPPDGFSLRWYAALIDADQILVAARNSLVVAVATMVLSVVLGTAGALTVTSSRAAWGKLMDSLLMSPLVLPALAFGFACLIYF